MIKNKGSIKDPSFTFKTATIVFFVFLFITFNFVVKNNNDDIDLINDNSEDLFIRPVLHNDLSEIIISQGNTVYASSPLYIPQTTQVLGANFEVPNCQKEIISYRVQPGETLSSIASKFNISTNTIVWANDIKNNRVSVNQDLIILPVSGIFHIIKSGETVSSVAKRYSVEEQDIVFCNRIENNVSIGDILVVPGGEIPKIVAPKPAPAPTTPRPVSGTSLASSGFILPLPRSGSYISQGLHWYNAIDIANDCGVPVYASAAGTVQETGYDSIGGYYVRIIHSGGIVTYYGHLSRILVSRGQSVAQGSMIGRVGNTGYTIGVTGCHVHFEVRGAANPFRNYRVGHRF